MSFLRIENLSHSYGKIRALDNFSLELKQGEIYSLVGPDGAGKSTLIRILCNLIKADSGTVTLDNHNMFENYKDVKELIGYMPQIFSLYPDLSVEENLLFYASIWGISGSEFRNRRDRFYRFSGLEPFSKRRAEKLSGGMKQKLALSCTLMHNPRLLILDEPTTGVDPLSRRQFWEILKELNADGVTILVATPYMDEVTRADRACFIIDGQKLSEGSPRQLADEYIGHLYYLDRQPKRSLISELNQINGLKARRFGSGLHLSTDESTSIDKLNLPLTSLGISPEMINPVKPSLEDRFIQLIETRQ